MNNQNTELTVTSTDKLKVALATESVQQQFRNALGDNGPAFTASIIELFASDSYLQACNPNAVILQALKAAVLKLPIVKSLGLAFIMAYNGVPEFQLGWKGYNQLALRSGHYRIINCDEVFEGELVTKNKLTGEFDLNGEKKSETVIGYFAHFELHNGYSKTLYMSVKQITDHAAKYSKSYNTNNSAWKKEFAAMAKKTVFRLLIGKYGILSVEMGTAFGDDDAADAAANEINLNANKANFTAAEVVTPTPPAMNGAQQPNSQAFNSGNNNLQPEDKPAPF